MLPLSQRQALLALFGEKQFRFTDGLSLPIPFIRNSIRSQKADGHAAFYECRLGDYLPPEHIAAFDKEAEEAGRRSGLKYITGTSTADMSLCLCLNFYAGLEDTTPVDTWIAANFFLNPPGYDPYDMQSGSVHLNRISEYGYPILIEKAVEMTAKLRDNCTDTLVRKRESFYEEAVRPYFSESGLLSGASINTVEKRLLLPFSHMFSFTRLLASL